ncbi:uncharacterized protein FFM5_15296 [Fusarium fujikuroi]|nr:uncharacterized protein FFM5_15296 [Fusarium fujikuroi]
MTLLVLLSRRLGLIIPAWAVLADEFAAAIYRKTASPGIPM